MGVIFVISLKQTTSSYNKVIDLIITTYTINYIFTSFNIYTVSLKERISSVLWDSNICI
jgi:hypothetical protein